LSLSNGVTLIIPAGALPQETECSLFSTDPEPISGGMLENGYERVASSFGVTPHFMSPDEPFQFLVPAQDLPASSTSADVVLVPSSNGIIDSREAGAQAGRVHPVWGAASSDALFATFTFPVLSDANYQPLVRIVEDDDGARDLGPPGWLTSNSCHEALEGWLSPSELPADIDTVVALHDAMSGQLLTEYLALAADPAAQADLLSAALRFVARVCLATYTSRSFFMDQLNFPAAEIWPGGVDPISWTLLRLGYRTRSSLPISSVT
jgi:hypothetical protein